VEQIVKILREQDKFVIAGHIGPDGDTIGSCFAIARVLAKLGKTVVVMLESYAPKYNILPGREYLYDAAAKLEMDVFVALDCADIQRLGASRSFFGKAKTTICIDHHATNPGFAEHNYIDGNASSTAEMVFGVIEALDASLLDADVAACLYAGIVGDTGGFRYDSTSRRTMEIATKLMEMRIPFPEIYREMLYMHSFAAAKAFGIALTNCESALDGRIVYTHITREMLASANADSSDMDNVAEYLMNTRDAEVALFFYERHQPLADDAAEPAETDEPSEIKPRKVKVSMRSKRINVGKIAAELGGGGHVLAAGCTVKGLMPEIVQGVLARVTREFE